MSASCDRPAHADLLPLQHLVEHLRWGCVDQAQQVWLLEGVFAEHAHQLAEKAAAEMSGCCDECDAAIDVMRAAIDPKATS